MSSRVHHLNCATIRPATSFGGRVTPPRMVSHVLLVERPDGLVLVDTGFGTADLARPARLGRPFLAAMRPALDLAEAAVTQVQRLGHRPADVRDIVLTHLDLDHAGGLGDFPQARVHVYDAELAAARRPATFLEKRRYLPEQWAHGPQWVEHHAAGDDWFGFACVTAVADDVVMVPLHGHTRGHCGVAVRRPEGGWLLHAGDAYFFHGELADPPSYSRGLTAFQRVMAAEERVRRENQRRLLELRAGHDDVAVFSAHDAVEFDRFAGAGVPG
jgi:glyoxylase-like metal-dependent hydrolase (beta-lactamase superfamily II)